MVPMDAETHATRTYSAMPVGFECGGQVVGRMTIVRADVHTTVSAGMPYGRSGFEQHLDRVVLFLLEDLVSVWGLVQG